MRSFNQGIPWVVIVAVLIAASQAWAVGPRAAGEAAPEVKKAEEAKTRALALPVATSRYNRGGAPGRYRDAQGRVRRFALKGESTLYDGGGRALGRVTEPVMLNIGAEKTMQAEGRPGKEAFLWAWATQAGSGWVARGALADPPKVQADESRNPKPPREAAVPLKIDTAAGREKLKGLVHINSLGELPRGGGNRGEHYGGRNPGARDYVYLLFAVPNVQRGGTAKDSLPDGSGFIQGLDEAGRPIVEVMTMYRAGDRNQPVPVTFIYGRAEGGDRYGWLARANVGER